MVNLIFLTKREAKNVLVNESHRAKQVASEISVKDILEVEEFLRAQVRNNLQGFREDQRKLFFLLEIG